MKKILKSIIFVAFMAVILVCLTGCANINYEIKLNQDGSGEIAYVMGYDKNFLTSMNVTKETLTNDDNLKEMKKDATEEGYTVEEYEDDNTYGFKATKSVKNVQEEFSIDNTIQEAKKENDDRILLEKSLLKTKFSQNAKMDLTFDQGTSDQEEAMAKALMGQMKISYKITLPFKAGENNATTVSNEGKTLEWNMQAGKLNEIKFVAEQDYTLIALGVLAVVLMIIVIIVISVTRKKTKKEEDIPVIKTVKKEEPKTVEEKPAVEEVTQEEIQETKTEEIVEEKEEEDKQTSSESEVQEKADENEDKEDK